MKKRSKDDGGGEPNIENKTQQLLPQELITEILLRLPVKSLVRFKCVCKSWLSLISNPHFATSHFDHTTVSHTHSHRLVFITTRASETLSIDFQASLNDDAAIISLNCQFLLPQSYLTLQFGGSCRGFLFLDCYQDFYLWNPSTGDHKQIPSSPIASIVDTNFFTYLYGFGYDPSTDDYLVVLGSYDIIATKNVLTHFEFFSLRANTWKEIEDAHLPYMNDSDNPRIGTLFNGAIHWLAYRADISETVIVAFDLTERRISEILSVNVIVADISENLIERRISEILIHVDSDFRIDCDLWVFRGLMSLWAMGNGGVEIWVMEEYGVNSSWNKVFVMSIDVTRDFYPKCSTNCGDIVGSDGGTRLMKYNDNGQLIEHRSYCDRPHKSQVALYTESLLPLPLPRDTQQA